MKYLTYAARCIT